MRCALPYLIRAVMRVTFACFVFAMVSNVPAQGLTNLNLQFVSNVKPVTNAISYGDVWAEGDLACLGVWLGFSAANYGVGIYSISNPAAPVLWFGLGTWMMALQYGDYPMDNHRYSLAQVKRELRREPLTSLGFGAAVMLGSMVPVLNFLIMPAAVCGATIYWVERLNRPRPAQTIEGKTIEAQTFE